MSKRNYFNMTSLKVANEYARARRYSEAIGIYKLLIGINRGLEHIYNFNIEYCVSRINTEDIREEDNKSDQDVIDISKSDLFDNDYYSSRYLLNEKIHDPIQHYLKAGWRRGYSPSSRFHQNFYLYMYPDIEITRCIPILHYIRHGQQEGRFGVPYEDLIDHISRKASSCFLLNEPKPNILKSTTDIIIPVFNGFEYLFQLFESITHNTYSKYRLIVADDCSSDPRVWPYLQKLKNENIISLLVRNESNIGFLKTVNRLVELVNNHFVILNTDTEVPSGWLERLMEPILMNADVASTTPFTNSGTICSFPVYIEDNDIYRSLSVSELDRYFKSVSPANNIEIPTGVGFCMGINYNVVKQIGMFDEVYKKGYCEENDWSRRAVENGYKHIHVSNLFVYHKHGGSFTSEEKRQLQRDNYVVLCGRYPDYQLSVDAIVNANDLHILRRSIKLLIDKTIEYNSIDDVFLVENIRICYVGHLSSNSGVGVAARSYIEAMRTKHLNVDCYDASDPQCFSRLLTDIVLNNPAVVILHFTANELIKFSEYNIDKLAFIKKMCCVIGVWAWESNEESADFLVASEYVDHVWAISHYMAEGLKSISCPKTVIPHPVSNKFINYEVNESILRIKRKHDFVVGYMFDFRSYDFRKNPFGAIDAFIQAFQNNSRAALILKVSGTQQHPSEFLSLSVVASKYDNVYLVDENLTDGQVAYYFRSIDVYLALFRAEGFGLTIAEAMASGKPVICPLYSGVLEYISDCKGIMPVPHDEIKIPEDWGPYKKGWTWADPNIEVAASHLKNLFNNRELSDIAGKEAKLCINNKLSYDNIGNLIFKDLLLAIKRKFNQAVN